MLFIYVLKVITYLHYLSAKNKNKQAYFLLEQLKKNAEYYLVDY